MALDVIPDSSDFPIEQQLMSNWCWANVTAELYSFYIDGVSLDTNVNGEQ
ncbi:hypothetical protein JN11_00169 [Mucilaginibacter frigoritolerans]|uniref:Uncharacterized protein n=1 Tax=Mucilaginibacter frigoritolerans TaxID=652788 RepID=A0A562UF90_9SPHI|nr:hypothetical protein [Mucilaginibacter frigoritolerans]TWJ04460.1 hypothetical protein JN11_00169 [Mucilaginibacter frigoritolerans]